MSLENSTFFQNIRSFGIIYIYKRRVTNSEFVTIVTNSGSAPPPFVTLFRFLSFVLFCIRRWPPKVICPLVVVCGFWFRLSTASILICESGVNWISHEVLVVLSRDDSRFKTRPKTWNTDKNVWKQTFVRKQPPNPKKRLKTTRNNHPNLKKQNTQTPKFKNVITETTRKQTKPKHRKINVRNPKKAETQKKP